MSTHSFWQSNNFQTLLIEDWGDEYTVFQPDSGKTHYLNQMSMHILSFLNQHSASVFDISSHLGEQFEQNSDKEFQQNIQKILYHLDALGLIKKVK
ncbi:PqqD family protein, HPr-rel-A system [Nitrosomonas aestuarii]|uniref:PqqD family protein, HPr-rel-A system n=1 Tax=Nitrosomonas aestuarii TaxID=52441 RepID=A0A1I4BHD8_9PROT|nr:HPr-rel-A system PqqD family peptide chaperone [Nitrosomonas aestuarii]SFK67366.1 PqqD family protein, HPr-rel-A system [Nitrosomonas aestuarii]